MAKRRRDAAGEWASARHGKLRRSSAWLNSGRILLTMAVVVLLSGASIAAYAVWGLATSVHTVDGPDAVAAGEDSLKGEVNILLVGSDSRQGQAINDGETGELNDVTLLLHVAADHKSATVISFPRDLMIPIPSCPAPGGGELPAMSEQQLNSTLSEGGLPCVMLTIEQLTGLKIPYGGLITFDGVIGMSNALGGVEVCLAEPIVDPNTDLDLPKGEVTLKGMEALQFLRTRHGVGDGGDTSRISNQQIFMSSLVRKMKSADTLSNPLKVYALAKAGVENIKLTSNMASAGFLQALAGTVKDIDLDRITFVQYPSFPHPYQQGRLTPDEESAKTLFDILKSGKPFEVAKVGEGVKTEGSTSTPPPATTAPPTTTEAPSTTAPSATAPPATTAPPTTTKLPDNISGQSSATQTCSQGRTVL